MFRAQFLFHSEYCYFIKSSVFLPSPAVYQALYLEELTLLDLSEKIAMLYSITPQQITHIYRQKPSGIHVLVCDEVLCLCRLLTNSSFLTTIEIDKFVLVCLCSIVNTIVCHDGHRASTS